MIRKSKRPLVSILCVTYNHSAFISQAIDSFLMQKTNFSYEICLGEDGSSDGTAGICRQYAERNPEKIRLFERDRADVVYIDNKPTGRFNFIETLNECKGEYIAICDGDDYWTDPCKLQKQIDFLIDKKYDLVHTNCSTLENGILKKRVNHHGTIKDIRSQLLIKNIISTLTVCVRRTAIQDAVKIIATKYRAADLALWMHISQKYRIGYINSDTAVHRVSYNSVSNPASKNDQWLFIKSAFELKYDFIERYEYSQKVISQVNHRWCRLLIKFYIKNEDSDIKVELHDFMGP